MILCTTDRLILRDLGPNDAEHILRLNSDPEVLKFVHDEPFADLEAARQWILDVPRRLPNGFGRWAIETKDGIWIGRCSLRGKGDGTTLMGYRLLREHWGRGYATEAVRALLDMAFSRLELTHVVSKVARENAASIRVLEKNGARFWKEEPCGTFAEAVAYRFDR